MFKAPGHAADLLSFSVMNKVGFGLLIRTCAIRLNAVLQVMGLIAGADWTA